ncbi:MAG: prolyl oligopeptidase family serine peptidase [Bacteroidales bacterium]|nr:prolyl oligopeptidase family serine peptidase [Bacteroidales bacterium]
MKRFIFLAFIVFASQVSAQDSISYVAVKSCMVAGPVFLQKPVLVDSINIFDKKYDAKQILGTKVSSSIVMQQSKEKQADPVSGYFTSGIGSGHQSSLHFFNFVVTAKGFTKIKLKVSSPQAFEIYVGGEKVLDKYSTQKSLDKAASVEWSSNVEPKSYEISIKCLSMATDSIPPSIKIDIKPDQPQKIFASATSGQRPFTLYDILEGERPTSTSISPDGKYVLLNTTVVLPKGKRSSQVKVMNATTGAVILNSSGDRGWRWMPRGSRLYSTTTGTTGRNLYVLDLSVMQEKLLAEDLPEGYFYWSPDETYLIFSITDKAPESKDGGVHQILTPQDRQAGWRNRSFLYHYDLATGVLRPLTFGYRSSYLSAISPDAKSIVFSTGRDHYSERPFSLRSFFHLHLNTMEVDTLWHDIKYGSVSGFSPDGKQLLLSGGPESFDKIGLDERVTGIPNPSDGQAYIYDLASKEIKAITRDFNPSIQNMYWNKVDNNIYFLTTDEDYVNVYRYQVKKDRFEKLDLPADVVQNISIADEALVLTGVGQNTSYASRAFRVDLKNSKTVILDNPMKPVMDQLTLGPVEDWNFQASDGTEIKGRIYYPYDFQKDKKYPMIVYYYGGTTPVNRGFDGRYSFHLYATMGYIVYVIQPSGAIGFGQEFSARHINAWGEYTADNIIEGTKKVCEAHPFVDRTKVGCIGASYGGFMTMYLQTRTDIFAAAVSHAGISDITSYWGEGYWGYSYNGYAAADSYPWNNADLFVGQSPLFSADKINTPLLLLHGDADTNVPVGESIQMFTALKILGKPVEFISIAGENHHIMDYDKRIRWNNSIFAWFAKWLQNDPIWWNEMYPKKNF